MWRSERRERRRTIKQARRFARAQQVNHRNPTISIIRGLRVQSLAGSVIVRLSRQTGSSWLGTATTRMTQS
jgi:hypothetical protein